ncbi:MAG TPA: hypothetical protein VKB16_09165 [Beijerinckiaceae bacterium]|nr:hypothetical protein [Beijerinckiaceae bacterium]
MESGGAFAAAGSRQFSTRRTAARRPYSITSSARARIADRETQSARGSDIHHQLEPDRLLDRQVARLCPFEHLVDKAGGASKQVRKRLAIGQESSGRHEVAVAADGGNPLLGGERGDDVALRQQQAGGLQQQVVDAVEGRTRDRARDVVGRADRQLLILHPEQASRALALRGELAAQRLGRDCRLVEIGGAARLRHDLADDLEQLRHDLVEDGETGEVAAGTREALDEAAADGIRRRSEHDRDRARRGLGGSRRDRAGADDQVDIEAGELGRRRDHALRRFGLAYDDREVLPIDPAEVAQALPQGRLGLSSGGAGRFGREIADPSGPLGTAGHGAGEDPDSGQADDQIAPLHSISPGLSRAVNRANS